jgi:pimeloyl-ACP methyl ester carboxylesterase
VNIERSRAAGLPYAAIGSGEPLVVFAGVWPTTGVESDAFVRTSVAPLSRLASTRRLIVLNRREGLARGITLHELADEYAGFVREVVGGPVDVLGNSTGGSIAQVVAAEHPDLVKRLVLLSAACRLGHDGRIMQADVAAHIRAHRHREAAGVLTAALAPEPLRGAARLGGRSVARQILHSLPDATDLATTLEAEDDFDLADLPTITTPTLILGGTHDNFYDTYLFHETARLIPNSTVMILPRGHGGVGSDPRARAAIAEFLA